MTTDVGRRNVLVALAGMGGGLALPGGFAWGAQGDQDFWAQPRRLRLYRPNTREAVNEVYWADGKIVEAGYLRVCQLLRDIQVGQSVYMDPRLLDLMRAVQGYMEYYGYNSPLMVGSGYRSPVINARTEGAALNSMHLHGKAIDFTMPGVPSNYMGALARHYQGGGVGFYTKKGFTHMDTGSVRYWSGDAPPRPKLSPASPARPRAGG